MLVLRKDQETLLESGRSALARSRSVLFVAPTGFGKTVCFSYMSSRAANQGKRVVVLVHRVELLKQVSNTLKRFSVRHTFVAPGKPYDHRAQVVVAMAATLLNRLHLVAAPDLLIIDEAHHTIRKSTQGKIIAAWPRTYLTGFTATPKRLSGEGLGECFAEMIVGPSTADLIAWGNLSPFEYFCPSNISLSGVRTTRGDYNKGDLEGVMMAGRITGNVVAHYQTHAAGMRAIVFCVSLKHCAQVVQSFRAAGISCAQIDGKQTDAIRTAVNRDFESGVIQVLISCDVVSEGYDVPAVEVAILLRPTQSEGLYLQQVGRALRTFPGKRRAIILDHVGNIKHGLPDAPREWSLDAKVKKKKKGPAEPVPPGVTICKACFCALPAGTQTCTNCGTEMEGRKPLKEVEGQLIKVTAEMKLQMIRARKIEQAKAETKEDLVALGTQRGYKFPRQWADKIIESRRQR